MTGLFLALMGVALLALFYWVEIFISPGYGRDELMSEIRTAKHYKEVMCSG